VIVRIATEGQYEVEDDAVAALNELDNDAVAACDTGDDERFRTTYSKLLDLIRTHGRPLDEGELEGSDLILPPPDVSLEEAKAEFSGEGLIPG
jgi:hypothetical protein